MLEMSELIKNSDRALHVIILVGMPECGIANHQRIFVGHQQIRLVQVIGCNGLAKYAVGSPQLLCPCPVP